MSKFLDLVMIFLAFNMLVLAIFMPRPLEISRAISVGDIGGEYVEIS